MNKPVMQFRVERDFAATEAALRESLQEEGFGVLTEVDVAAVLRQKIGVEIGPHKLLGICNPRLAHASIEAEPDVAAFLPCGLSLREGATPNETIVTVQDPGMISDAFEVDGLEAPATEAKTRLRTALTRLGAEL